LLENCETQEIGKTQIIGEKPEVLRILSQGLLRPNRENFSSIKVLKEIWGD